MRWWISYWQGLEEKVTAPSQLPQNSSFLHQYPQTTRRWPGSSSHQLICWNCGRRGHIACLCKNPKMQGNKKPQMMWVICLKGYKYKRLEIFLFHLFLYSPYWHPLQIIWKKLSLSTSKTLKTWFGLSGSWWLTPQHSRTYYFSSDNQWGKLYCSLYCGWYDSRRHIGNWFYEKTSL